MSLLFIGVPVSTSAREAPCITIEVDVQRYCCGAHTRELHFGNQAEEDAESDAEQDTAKWVLIAKMCDFHVIDDL